MRVAQKFAGYSLADADNLRKACGKKNRELMAKEREKFVDRLRATGYGAELGTELFDIIEQFADYAFNKSHSYGYGLVAYQTAYLKANYPVEYLAALLTSVKTNLDKAAVYLAECRAMGIEVLVPDVNRVGQRLRRRARPRDGGPGSHPLRAVGGAQRGRGPGRARSSPSATPTARSPTSTTSATASTSACSTSARSSRSSRPVASTRSAIPARACCTSSSRSSIPRCRGAGARPRGSVDLFSMIDDSGGDGDGAASTSRPDPRHRVRQEAAPRVREGDARPLRDRPPADGGRGGAAATHRVHHRRARRASTTARCARSVGWSPTSQRKWTKKGDLMAVFVLEDLQTLDRGHGLPQDHAEERPHARRRRRGLRHGPGRQPRRHRPS